MATSLIDVANAHAAGRIAWILEGGYDMQGLCASVGAVAAAATGMRTALPEDAVSARHKDAIDRSVRALQPHWDGLR